MNPSGAQGEGLLIRRKLMQGEMNLAMPFAKNTHHIGEGAIERGGDDADGEMAELSTPSHASQAHGFVGIGEGRAGAIEEHDAGFSEGDFSACPVEELYAQFAFELLNLLAERGLGDGKTLGGATEMQRLGDGGEIAQMPQFH